MITKYRTLVVPMNETILIIDDDDVIRILTEHFIKCFGYNTLIAVNGFDGINKYMENREKISVVLLDIIMPVMNGEETFYKLKQIDNNIKIIIMSGFSGDVDISELTKNGAIFLPKPFMCNSLKNAIEQIKIKVQPQYNQNHQYQKNQIF